MKNMATRVCPSGAGLRLGSLAPPSYHWLESQDRATQRIRRQAPLLCTCKTHTARGVSPGGEKAEGINAISIFNVILTSSANIHFKLANKTMGFIMTFSDVYRTLLYHIYSPGPFLFLLAVQKIFMGQISPANH